MAAIVDVCCRAVRPAQRSEISHRAGIKKKRVVNGRNVGTHRNCEIGGADNLVTFIYTIGATVRPSQRSQVSHYPVMEIKSLICKVSRHASRANDLSCCV